jgi:hypothetical protein
MSTPALRGFASQFAKALLQMNLLYPKIEISKHCLKIILGRGLDAGCLMLDA